MKPKWWGHLFPSFFRQFSGNAGDVLSFMATLDESQVIGVTSDALGRAIPSHRSFELRHETHNASAEGIQRSRPSSRRRSSSKHDTAAASSQQQRSPTTTSTKRAAAARGLRTSGAALPAPFSLECSEGTSEDLLEVVVASSTGNRRVSSQTDGFRASKGCASSIQQAKHSTSLKHVAKGMLKDGEVQTANKRKDVDMTRSVTSPPARADADSSIMLPSAAPACVSSGTASKTRASSRPKRPLQPVVHDASQSSGARLPSLASASASAALAGAPAEFIEKIDSKSDRHYWENLTTKTRSWAPPDVRDNTAVTSQLFTAGGASARNVATLERRLPDSNDSPSSNEQGNQNVSSQLEEALHAAAPPVQRDVRKSASVRHQDDTQRVHTIPALLSASTLAAERMRRQNLANLAAMGDVPHDASHALETRAVSSDAAVTAQAPCAAGGSSVRNLYTLERGMPDSNQSVAKSPSSNAQGNQKVSNQLEEVVVHSVQRDVRKSASVRHQDDTQRVHTIPALLSASTLAAERMRRQNLANLAATGAHRTQSSAAVKLGQSIREVHTTHVEASPNVHANQNVSIELEEVAGHSVPPAALQQRQDDTKHAHSLPLAGFPESAESGTIANGLSYGIQELQAGVKASAVEANAASQRLKQPTHVAAAVPSGSSQLQALRPRDPAHAAKPCDAPPPPIDDGDLKLAKRREEKVAARAAQQSLMSALGARGSKPLHRNPE